MDKKFEETAVPGQIKEVVTIVKEKIIDVDQLDRDIEEMEKDIAELPKEKAEPDQECLDYWNEHNVRKFKRNMQLTLDQIKLERSEISKKIKDR